MGVDHGSGTTETTTPNRVTCRLNHTHKHGTHCYHNGGCRCRTCRDTVARLTRERYRAKAYGTFQPDVPAVGTVRRIQGLQVLGWTLDEIAESMGMNRRNVQRILHQEWVRPETRDRVAEITRAFVARGRGASNHVTTKSLNKGWLSPFVWDDIDDPNATPADVTATGDYVDEVRIWNAVNGPPRRHRLTSTERTEAIRLLHGKRWTAERIAEQIGCTPRTVERVRARLGLVTVPFTELIKRGEAA